MQYSSYGIKLKLKSLRIFKIRLKLVHPLLYDTLYKGRSLILTRLALRVFPFRRNQTKKQSALTWWSNIFFILDRQICQNRFCFRPVEIKFGLCCVFFLDFLLIRTLQRNSHKGVRMVQNYGTMLKNQFTLQIIH